MQKYQPIWKDYRLHIAVIIISIIAELIGSINIEFGDFSMTLSPMIFSMIMMTVFYLVTKGKILNEDNARRASSMMSISVGLLIAKMGVSSGAALDQVLEAGIPIVLQNIGEGFSFILGLPIAMYVFKMGKEAIGMTFGVSRETNVAIISNKYGPDSPEFRGVMTNYITGTVFGVIVISLIVSVLLQMPFISEESIALATGIGSASMMAGGLGTLIEQVPEKAQTLEAYAALSNVISTAVSIYITLLIGLPLTERSYGFLDRFRKNKNDESGEMEPAVEQVAEEAKGDVNNDR